MTTTISPERLAELRAMPYEEYLTTPEWQATRKRILKRDNYQCQGCHAKHVALNVHHYTYERLGCEEDTDLVTLCVDCHEELHRRLADPPHLPFLYKCGIGAAAAVLGTIGIEGFLQAPLPAEIGVLIGAYLLAKNSPTVYGVLKEKLPEEVMGWLGQAPRERMPGGVSLVDAWLGRSPKSRVLEEAEEQKSPEEIATYLQRTGASEEIIAAVLGKDTADDGDDEEESISIAGNIDDNDDLITVALRGQKPIHIFSDLLKTGWRPTFDQIYVGTDKNGKHLFIPVTKLWHIALAGATGYGKSSLMRLLMAQLCYLKLSVVLLNPHYMIYDLNHEEDWTPYTPYLKRDPMECKKMANIEIILRWMHDDLLEKRKERASRGESAGKPFFFILDEYPDIKAEIKDAPELVGKLLRQGRKYGIYLIVASQNYDVKTLGVEGEGGVRKCFRTIFYVGGDPVSVKELLNKKVSDIPENDLGQGTVMLKCATIPDPLVIYVPYLDNLSLYILLGPTTYIKKPVQEVQTDELDIDVTRNGAPIEVPQNSPKFTDSEASSVTRNDVTLPAEVASQNDVSPVSETLLPGWTKQAVDLLPRLYRVSNNRENCLIELGISTSQDNRRFATEILKKHGLWKEK